MCVLFEFVGKSKSKLKAQGTRYKAQVRSKKEGSRKKDQAKRVENYSLLRGYLICQLPIAYCWLSCGLSSVVCGLWSVVCGLWSVVRGLIRE